MITFINLHHGINLTKAIRGSTGIHTGVSWMDINMAAGVDLMQKSHWIQPINFSAAHKADKAYQNFSVQDPRHLGLGITACDAFQFA